MKRNGEALTAEVKLWEGYLDKVKKRDHKVFIQCIASQQELYTNIVLIKMHVQNPALSRVTLAYSIKVTIKEV